MSDINKIDIGEYEVVVLSVFGDESHEGKKEKVFAVSGVAGTDEEWKAFCEVWNYITQGKPFHAADCEAGQGIFKGIPKHERLKLYADLVKAIISSPLMGFSSVTDVKAFYELHKGAVKNIPYHHCFFKVVQYFGKLGIRYIPTQRVTFTFDSNVETNVSANLLYHYLSNTNNWNLGDQLADFIKFDVRGSHVGIQVADIIAREAMKHFSNFFIGPKKYDSSRRSFVALKNSGKYDFEFCGRTYWQWHVDQYDNLMKQFGIQHSDYEKWRKDNKLPNNIITRHRYLLTLKEPISNHR